MKATNRFGAIVNCASVAVLALASGCASIIDGTTQIVTVEAGSKAGRVAGASCKLQNDKGIYLVTAPGSVAVRRAYGDMMVECEKAGHETGKRNFKSATKGLVAGNILIGGIIGVGVDAATGAAYDYPDSMIITMNELVENSLVPAAPVPEAATGAMK